MVGLRVVLDLVMGRKSGGGHRDGHEIDRELSHRDAVGRKVAGRRQNLRHAVAVRRRLRHDDLMLLLLLLRLVLLLLLLLLVLANLLRRLLLRFLLLRVFLLWSFWPVFVVHALYVFPVEKNTLLLDLPLASGK